jgi:predicted metal-dependent phosphotriesterase family hydrolase
MRDAEYDYGLDPGERFEPDDGSDEPFNPARPHVMTALGPVDPGALGFTLPNEHLIAKPSGADIDWQLDDVALAVAELEGYAVTGGRALVDLTAADYGRSIDDILWVAQRVPVHIVLATGRQGIRFEEPLLRDRSIDEIAGKMIDELTAGIDGTGARAGLIVVGTALDEVTSTEARVLRAAVAAHRATGVAISLQPRGIAAADQMLAMMRDEGVDASHVIVGQVGAPAELEQVRRLLDAGVFVVIDQWTGWTEQTAKRAALVKQMFDDGFGEQVLISGRLARRSEWLAYGGGPGFVHFIDYVPLALMDAGLGAPAVRQVFVENPARALTTVRVPSA